MVLFVVDEISTDIEDVIEGLIQRSTKVEVLTSLHDIQICINICDATGLITIKDRQYHIDEISGVFIRISHLNFDMRLSVEEKHRDIVRRHLNEEMELIVSFILESFPHINVFGFKHFQSVALNKLIYLTHAVEFGLAIPESAIVSDRSGLQRFLDKYGQVITKPLARPIQIISENLLSRLHGTTAITQEDVEGFPLTFFPSFVQRRIDKLYDVRVIYFNGKFWSAAIMSQDKAETRVDCRRYNHGTPPCILPYSLPIAVHEGLTAFMKRIKLDYGTIDLIRGTDNVYYFLEVNPQGQYGFSAPALNLNFSDSIAEYLS
jgi:hypothetical protein